ncbi:protein downstream neighbor of Son [Tripterygium wilfordii]|uniref:Protein downstream neighbor of Son n=1 Tax=Tripterygium wilfordii TaxID=458696 RepID=A0A7J7CIW6_TRIWF|nr:protein downstream neighbor of Son [Tripterygium wilfordii]KAF5734002.1 protein downstream neighbor of Son [Tripterygium wilfordii]
MAKVAAASPLSSSSLQIGGGTLQVGPMVKRKKTSELRGEQLKQTNIVELVAESSGSFPASTCEVENGIKKPELSRNPRYIDTRVDEVYPAKKSRLRTLFGKENAKENVSSEQPSSLKNLSVLSSLAAKRRQQLSSLEKLATSAGVAKDGGVKTSQTIEKCSFSAFRTVTELSSGGDRSSGLAVVDMNKALKGLAALAPAVPSGSDVDGDPTSTFSGNFRPECCVPGQKSPLDLTLKTKMRVISSSSVNWIHRSLLCSTYNGMPQFTSHSGFSGRPNTSSNSGHVSKSPFTNSKALHSWIYPQSNLPPSLISVLTSSSVGEAETYFLRQRQLAWEESFRSLYYMLRKSICKMFYVCTSHFVVMFTVDDGLGRTKRSCNAYISQSTRGLRSLLRQHDVSFSMPLCYSKVEQATTEDLVELSEIEKHNLGQTRRPRSLADVDNTPESLLAFGGNEKVHGLYDFLLNYRSFLTFLAGADVPVLYSPMPFQNASISAPEIRCMEIKRSEHIAAIPRGNNVNVTESKEGSTGFTSSIEIKDAYLTPWIISRICAIMGSEGGKFEANFVTERTSTGLNVALGTFSEKSDSLAASDEHCLESSCAFGIAEARVVPCLHSGILKSLKYCNGSYTASLSPV